MASKQKHDLGHQKRAKNALLNPEKLSREARLARRISDHSKDMITAIELDAAAGHEYAIDRSARKFERIVYPLGFMATPVVSKPPKPMKVISYGH